MTILESAWKSHPDLDVVSLVCSLPRSGSLFRLVGRNKQKVFSTELFYMIDPPDIAFVPDSNGTE